MKLSNPKWKITKDVEAGFQTIGDFVLRGIISVTAGTEVQVCGCDPVDDANSWAFFYENDVLPGRSIIILPLSVVEPIGGVAVHTQKVK